MKSPPFNAYNTLGALLVGALVSCSLFGIVIVQTYIYYKRFPSDRLYLKLMVLVVWLCELGHCICICHALYFICINRYGDPMIFLLPPKSLDVAIGFSAVIAPVVQIFFADRVRVVTGKLVIPVACWILSSIRGILTFLTMGESWVMISLPQFEHDWKWLLACVLGIGAAVDLVVAATLSYYLKNQKAKGHNRRSSMIDIIIAWTIQTGFVTSMTGIAMLACFLAMPGNYVWLAIFTFLARTFSCSLLASLNGRIIHSEKNVFELGQNQRARERLSTGNLNTTSSDEVTVHISKLTEENDSAKNAEVWCT